MKPSLLFHLIRKDIRAVRWTLLLMWAVIAWMAFVPFSFNGAQLSRGLLLVAIGLHALILAQVMHLDLDRDTSPFIRTRPVSTLTLFVEKSLMLLIVGLLPVLVAGYVQILRIGLSLEFRDYVWLWTQGLLVFIGCTGIAAALAAYTQDAKQFIGGVIVGCVMAACVLVTLEESTMRWVKDSSALFHRLFPAAPSLGGDISRKHLSFTLLGCAGYLIAWCRYANWQPFRKLTVIAAAFVMTTLCMRHWSYNLLPSIEGTPAQKAQAENDLKSFPDVQIGVQWFGWGADPSFGGGIKNIPDRYILEQSGWKSSAQLADGRVIRSSGYPPTGIYRSYGNIAALLQISPESLFGDYEKFHYVPTVSFKTESSAYPDLNPLDVRKSPVSGERRFEIYEPVLSQYPLSKDLVHHGRGIKIKFRDVRATPRLQSAFATLTSIVSYKWRRPLLAFALLPSGELLTSDNRPLGIQSDERSVFYPAGFAADTIDLQFSYQTPGKAAVISNLPHEDWLKGAQIYLLDARHLASFSRTFEFKDTSHVADPQPSQTSTEAGKP